ncbi:MAG: DUF58 domain-containing protein [Myxococcales bacterium]|nr:DUF58 domain-containing protein [Myxococcales bacterium]
MADRVPLTGLGLTVLLGSLLAWEVYATGHTDFVLRAAVVLAWAMLAVSTVGVALTALVVMLRLRRLPAQAVLRRTEVGRPFTTDLKLPRLAWWPLVQLDVRWDGPPDFQVSLQAEGPHAREKVTPQGRGFRASLTRRVTIHDIFGLAALTLPHKSEAALRVVPAMAPGHMRLALRHAAAEGMPHPDGEPVGDLVEMRRYAPGDPMRMVLWKVYARSRRLLVRMPERAITPQPSLVAWFVPGPGDEATASAARTFIERGELGEDFVFGADGTDHLLHTAHDAVEAIIDSAHVRQAGGQGLHSLRALDRHQLNNTVFFVPAQAGPWLDRLKAFCGALPARPTFVVAIDAVTARAPGAVSRALLTHAERPAEAPLVGDLKGLVDRLTALGDVQLLHRPSGRRMSPGELDRRLK